MATVGLRLHGKYKLLKYFVVYTVPVLVSTAVVVVVLFTLKRRSDLYSVLSNIRTGPTDANAFRGHRLTTQKGYTYQKEIKGPRKVNTHAIIGK